MKIANITAAILPLALAAACTDAKDPVVPPDFGPEVDDGKDDSARRPTSIEDIAYGEIRTADFTMAAQYRAFVFAGEAGQKVDLYVDGLDEIDTVLLVYKVSASTGRPFGSALAWNDDTSNPTWMLSSNAEPNELSSSLNELELPETRDYALVATTFLGLYEGTAEVVVKTPVPPSSTCGGFIGALCPEGQICMFDPGMCQVPDMIGHCVVPPAETGFGCAPPNPAVDNRVCGCDGSTYVDRCHARLLGASILHDGPCEPSACQPECGSIGTEAEGFYGCDGALLLAGPCADCTVNCSFVGGRSEGWYSSCGGLIQWATCSNAG